MRTALRPAGPAPVPPRSQRLALGAALLAVVLPLAACGTDEDDASSAPTVSATSAPGGAASGPAEPSPSVSPDDAQVVSVTVAGGAVTGVEPRTSVPLGTKVRLSVTSDTVDEVHVHGYELTTALAAGQAAQLEFVADRPGIYEVELHDAGTVLTRLQVQ